jgi:hypothetical protein
VAGHISLQPALHRLVANRSLQMQDWVVVIIRFCRFKPEKLGERCLLGLILLLRKVAHRLFVFESRPCSSALTGPGELV